MRLKLKIFKKIKLELEMNCLLTIVESCVVTTEDSNAVEISISIFIIIYLIRFLNLFFWKIRREKNGVIGNISGKNM